MKTFAILLLAVLATLSFGSDSITTAGITPTTTWAASIRSLISSPTFWMTLGTWALAFVGWKTYAASKVQARQELRAYIHVEHPSVSKNALHEIFSYPIWYTNYGKTPATNFRFSIGVHFTKGLVGTGYIFPELKENPRAPVGPGQKVPWEHSVNPKRQVNAKFPDDKDVEYLHGRCDYFDGFANQVTTFRFYRKKGEDWFNADSAGNNAT